MSTQNDLLRKALLIKGGTATGAVGELINVADIIYGRDVRGLFQLATQLSAVDIQIFGGNGTWVKPTVGSVAQIVVVGGGGGGAGGACATSTGNASGGGGG